MVNLDYALKCSFVKVCVTSVWSWMCGRSQEVWG